MKEKLLDLSRSRHKPVLPEDKCRLEKVRIRERQALRIEFSSSEVKLFN
jgi:hypothetical protein